MRIGEGPHVVFWLQAEVRTVPRVRLLITQLRTFAGRCLLFARLRPVYPRSRRFRDLAGLPVLTHLGHLGVRSANQLEPKISDPRTCELVVRLIAQSLKYEESLDQHQIGGCKAVCHQIALDLAFDLNAN